MGQEDAVKGFTKGLDRQRAGISDAMAEIPDAMKAPAAEAPRIYGHLGLGFTSGPYQVVRAELKVSGDYLRAMAPGHEFRPGINIQVSPVGQPVIQTVIIEYNAEGDFYLLDWRSSRQPRAVPL